MLIQLGLREKTDEFRFPAHVTFTQADILCERVLLNALLALAAMSFVIKLTPAEWSLSFVTSHWVHFSISFSDIVKLLGFWEYLKELEGHTLPDHRSQSTHANVEVPALPYDGTST